MVIVSMKLLMYRKMYWCLKEVVVFFRFRVLVRGNRMIGSRAVMVIGIIFSIY